MKRQKTGGEFLENVAQRCRDTITGSLLVDPVIAEDGHTYERRAIVEWFKRRIPATSPMTKEVIGTSLKPNYALRAIVEDLVASGGLTSLERAEWHLARGKILCQGRPCNSQQRETRSPSGGDHHHFAVNGSSPRGGTHRSRSTSTDGDLTMPTNELIETNVRYLANEIRRMQNQDESRHQTIMLLPPDVRAARHAFAKAEQLLDDCDDPNSKRVYDETIVCRDICDRFLDLERLRDHARVTSFDLDWARTAYDAVFRGSGVRLTMFQKLSRGTRVRVLNDRRLVIDAFQAQEDVISLPHEWESALGQDFIIENYDSFDSTYVIVHRDRFHLFEDNTKLGSWWPFSTLALLP